MAKHFSRGKDVIIIILVLYSSEYFAFFDVVKTLWTQTIK